MSSKAKCVLRKRKEMLHEKLNQISNESQNIIDLIHDIQIRATSIVSDLDLETNEREFLLKYPVTSKKLEEWQAQISRISYDLDVLVCEENRREPEELNITSTTSHCNVEKDDDVKVWTIPSPIQESDILDMRFVSGDSPHDFWLRFYCTKEVKKISSSIQKLFEANKLQCLKSSEIHGDVCVCNGSDYFRGRVISQCIFSEMTYLIRNVDNGDILKVERSNLFRLTKEIADFPVQAINCCLEGVLGDPVLWDNCVVKLFHQVMMDSSLVVTVCSVPTETCSKFVVKVDNHNEMRVESKIDLSSWITYSVLPTLVQRRTNKSPDALKILFDFLRLRPELENSASSAVDHSSEPQNAERKENKDSGSLFTKDNIGAFFNSHNEKSNMQQLPLKSAQECSSFVNFNSTAMYAMSPIKEKSNMQVPPSNAAEECSSFLNCNSTSAQSLSSYKDKSNAAQQGNPFLSLSSPLFHAMPPHKEQSSSQPWSLGAEPQSNAFLNLRSPQPLHSMAPPSQYVPPFLPYQNPSPLLLPVNPSSVNASLYPYASQMQPSLLRIPQYQSPGPSVALQQNQFQSFQLQNNSPVQNRLTKQHNFRKLPAVRNTTFPQSSAEDAQKKRESRSWMSLEGKLKEPALNTLDATKIHIETASVIKQALSAEAKSFVENCSASKQEMSSKVNSKNTNVTSKISLKYPNLKFEAGKRYMAFVVYINDPDDFYIHVACENTAFIEKLDQEMTQNYKTCSVKLKNKEQAKIMLYESWCAVYYKDEDLWHRGKVIDWKDDNDTALEVQYIDYGEVREVDLSLIKPLKEEYTKLPICATRCRLANIHPPELQEKSKQSIWPPETVELFRVLAVRDKLNSVVVTNCSSDPISVLLVTEDNTVINKVLLELEYAVAFKPIEFDPSLPIQVIKDEENVGKNEKLDGSALEKPAENCQKKDSLLNGGLKETEKTAENCQKKNSVLNGGLKDPEKTAENCQKKNSVLNGGLKDPGKTAEDCQKKNSLLNGGLKDPGKTAENCQKKNSVLNGGLKDPGKTPEDYAKVTGQEDTLQNWDPMAEDYFSIDNTKYHDDENACYAVSGYVPQDEQRLCKFFTANGHCFKGVTCTKEHSLPNPDGWTTDQESVLLNPFTNLILPPVGTLVSVEVTAIYTVNMFYAHVLWEGRITEDEETLLTLNKCINNKDNISKMMTPQIIPAVGQLVLARFMADGTSNFFRARVIDTNIEENKVQVVYIDYGNTEWVSKKDVREMEPRYLHLPFQAVECYISNVNPKTDSEKALLEVSDLILGKQLVGSLTSKNILGHAEIELWDNDQKIADKLIEKGYAYHRDSPLFLTDDAYIIPG